jgi:mono/diheme cytochrome c family protein
MTSRLLSVAAAIGCTVLLWAAGATAAGPNPNRGKSLFKSNCKTCHVKGGGAKDFSPLTKTQAQWKRAFAKDVEACAKKVVEKGGKPLGKQDLADMEFYLVSHAADSDQPETCGIK